ncbi:hypothetical protein AB0E69_10990 [Kribbella sp. NPDC026611]|uniref:hypothetical protein n=1 Tax=Kribbella sp. NPDC026611 TaxID=3154911 RepID=UPI0033DD32FA
MGNVRVGLASLFCLAVALGGTGCGRSDAGHDTGVASAAGSTGTATGTATATPSPSGTLSDQDRAVKFAQCMRANGIPGFKDPKPGDGGVAIDLPDGVSQAQADAAMAKCKDLLPGGGTAGKIDPQQIEKNRALAKCMRQNGVPNYPDPGPDGGIKIEGVDPNSTAFKSAQQKCQKDLPPGSSVESHG